MLALVIVMNIMLALHMLGLLGWIVDATIVSNTKIQSMVRFIRAFPGTPLDILLRAVTLNIMWCCYRESKNAR